MLRYRKTRDRRRSYWVKIEWIDRENIIPFPVTFEREIFALLWVINMMHTNSSFYGTHQKSLLIRECSKTPSLVFEWRLDALELRLRILQVEDDQITISSSHNHKGIIHCKCVTALRKLLNMDRIWLPCVPIPINSKVVSIGLTRTDHCNHKNRGLCAAMRLRKSSLNFLVMLIQLMSHYQSLAVYGGKPNMGQYKMHA